MCWKQEGGVESAEEWEEVKTKSNYSDMKDTERKIYGKLLSIGPN